MLFKVLKNHLFEKSYAKKRNSLKKSPKPTNQPKNNTEKPHKPTTYKLAPNTRSTARCTQGLLY